MSIVSGITSTQLSHHQPTALVRRNVSVRRGWEVTWSAHAHIEYRRFRLREEFQQLRRARQATEAASYHGNVERPHA